MLKHGDNANVCGCVKKGKVCSDLDETPLPDSRARLFRTVIEHRTQRRLDQQLYDGRVIVNCASLLCRLPRTRYVIPSNRL
jgi:hypothetical protein